jgi:hypothetical protein
MEVIEAYNVRHWIGTSDEDKPTAATGSTLHVVNTGEELIYYNGGWERDRRRIYALRNA